MDLYWTTDSLKIFQGLSPTFIGSLSDNIGRRPVYLFCFIIYTAANIGLGFSKNFMTLLLLRCLQSTGSSSTVNLAYGVTADVISPKERGAYIGLASVGPILGPSIGPILGGLITQFFGWRYIFFFLAGLSILFLIHIIIIFPETCRNLVGNGSIPPQSLWNKSLVSLICASTAEQDCTTHTNQHVTDPQKGNPRNSNPFKSLGVLFRYPTSPVIIFNGFSYAVYYAVTTSLPYLFHDVYHFEDVEIGLSYIPVGIGTVLAALGNGFIVDWNYRRLALKAGIDLDSEYNMDYQKAKLNGLSVVKARLQVAIPAIVVSGFSMLAYGWTLSLHTSPVIPLILLFVFGWGGTAAYSVLNLLIVDVNPKSAASATAANNLVRCTLGASGAAIIMPVTNALGVGWAFTGILAVWVVLSPIIMIIYFSEGESGTQSQ